MKDPIERQDAIDEIRKCRFVVDAIEKIRGLPSVQPEIIRCKDCKYNDYNWRRMSVKWLPCMDVRTGSRKVEKMKLTLTEEQIKQMYEDSYLDIELEDRAKLYFEFNNDKTFAYGEIYNPKSVKDKRNGYAFGEEDLKKLIPTKPGDPNWHHEWPMCPSCGTYMIYNFECCPKCGQTLLWKEFTGDR